VLFAIVICKLNVMSRYYWVL